MEQRNGQDAEGEVRKLTPLQLGSSSSLVVGNNGFSRQKSLAAREPDTTDGSVVGLSFFGGEGDTKTPLVRYSATYIRYSSVMLRDS